MNYQEMFAMTEEHCASDPNVNTDFQNYHPTVIEYKPVPPMTITESFQHNVQAPPMYNLGGYISPYTYENWGSPTKFLSFINDEQMMPPMIDNKLDPNKIFNADIASLRTSAADQLKITRAFERKLMKSLATKDSENLTEMDILAMQAITASRNTIIAANNGQVAIKKNIAEIKLKQAANKSKQVMGNNGAVSNDSGGSVFNGVSIGKEVLDGLINIDMSAYENANIDQGFDTISEFEAGELIGQRSTVQGDDAVYENMGAQVYAVRSTDNDYQFEAYDNEGNYIPDYVVPNTDIVKIDVESGLVQDSQLNQYPIKL